MKAVAIRYLNEIISISILTLMAGALIAGQIDATGQTAGSVDLEWQTTSIRHNGK
jgi:hypothetical protein